MHDESSPAVTFVADSLLSKWGFGDGGLLDELILDHYEGSPRGPRPRDPGAPSPREVLARVVRELVLPKIDQEVEVEVVGCHNPIRATTVDGREVEYPWDQDKHLTPATVDVPVSAILRIADAMAAERREAPDA